MKYECEDASKAHDDFVGA